MRASGMEPDATQLRVMSTPGNQLLLCHRQWGKSTTVGAIALEDACSEPGALVLLVSRSMRQSGELFRKVKQFYHATRPLPLIQDSALSLELANHSRIVSLPGSEETIVGYSKVKRLILDEAARIPDPTFYAVRPMLAMSQGSIIALSTPFGKRGWFYEAWAQQTDEHELDVQTVERLLEDLNFPWMTEQYALGEYSEPVQLPVSDQPDTRDYGWTRTMVTAPENRRITRKYLANERRSIPELWFRQEWLCEFLDIGSQLFRTEDLEAMIHPELQPYFQPDAESLYAREAVRPDLAPWDAGNGAVWIP